MAYSVLCCKLREYFYLFISLKSVLLHYYRKLHCSLLDAQHKLNVNETFRRLPGRLLNVFYTCNSRIVSSGSTENHHQNQVLTAFLKNCCSKTFEASFGKLIKSTVKFTDSLGKWSKLNTHNTFK